MGGTWNAYEDIQQGNGTAAAVDILGALAGATQLLRPCFAAGTPLLTPEGSKPIEALRPGDWVLARPEHDPAAAVAAQVVEEVFERLGRIVHVHVGGQVIRTTGEHPFWVQGQGWTPAGQLQPGQLLSSHEGGWVAVGEVFDTGAYEPVYNLRVAQYHTYFVGSPVWGFSVWAHNSSCAYRDTFFHANPELQGDVWGHHAVEQQVLRRYPGLFTKPQLDSIGNLRGIPNDLNASLPLSFIRKAWNRFYKSYPNAPRSDIEHFAEIIDRFVGNMFNPPV